MNTKANESFSAFMDGEASELDVQRMLKAMENEPSVVGHWHDLAKTQAAIQNEPVLERPLIMSVSQPVQEKERKTSGVYSGRLLQWGLAAAVATVVIAASNVMLTSQSNPIETPVIAVQNQSVEQTILLTQQQYEAQQQLEQFLREHAEQAAFTTGHVVVPAPLEWIETE